MATCEVIKMGTGKSAILVNKKDYEEDFPLNKSLREIKAQIEEAKIKKEAKEKENK